jgi:N-acetylmuramoyl-L-alanine amidase
MATLSQTRGRVLAAVALIALTALPLSGWAGRTKKQQALSEFQQAEKMREALNGMPADQRTKKEYQRVADAYRRVYYTSPTSMKADASVVAVAELLAEMGHAFKDEKALHDSIGQYEFLRREYPGSTKRVEALFTIAQIYKQDLNDPDKAKETFQELLKRYPGSELADEARTALEEIDHPSTAKNKRAKELPQASARPLQDRSEKPDKPEDRTGRPMVTGIRHWSTPDYTRVAIDLEDEVKYEAGRVPNPDRIFFDLQDTKLASTLVGKTFDVSDGFLKKIRIAQFARGTTRVVLEVDDVSDYSAFLLPNPYRLIIDIHGRQPQRETNVAKASPTKTETKTEASVPKPVPPKSEPKTETKTEPIKSADAAKPIEKPAKPAEKKAEPPVTAAKNNPATPAAPRKIIVEAEDDSEQAKRDKTGKIADKVASGKSGADKPVADKAAATTAKAEKPIASPNPVDKPAEKVEGARLDPPVVKATDKASSKPIAESVAPRATKGNKTPVSTAHAARPTSDGDTSLIRALGLKIGSIVVDAGHGGHDTGTIGPSGFLEKDLTLDVALRLGKMLESRLGADVVYTRDDDTFIPLETRTAIANQQQADLFISIHANSSSDVTARGVETYYLNFTSSADALAVAARENAVSEKSIHELQDLVKKIAMKEKIEESREFATDVQKLLHAGLAAKAPAIRDRGVKKAPFIVLIGANMPSILAEISFLSNPADEKRLQTPEYRQKIAESLYKGIARYVSGLSGVKVAVKGNGALGQQ